MNAKEVAECLKLKAVVTLSQPVNGYWDGGAKSQFIFTPSLERSPGKPAIRWGSWSANIWFVINQGKSLKSHLAQVRRKLRGNPARTIEFVN